MKYNKSYWSKEENKIMWMNDVQKTSTISWLSKVRVQSMLKDFTHSELRSWKTFIETMGMKQMTRSKGLLFN